MTQEEHLLRALIAVIFPSILHKGHLTQFPIALATPPVMQLLQVCDRASTGIFIFTALSCCLWDF